MRNLLLLLFIICTIHSYVSASSQEHKYIEVKGTAYIEVDPDIAILSIILSSEDAATKNLDKSQQLLYSIVDNLGLNAKENLSYNSIVSDYVRRKSSVIQKSYTLKVTDLDKIADLYSALTDQGISNISISEFKSSKESDYLSQLRTEAVKNAKSKANTLAEAAEAEIYGVLSIIDYSSDNFSTLRTTYNSFLTKSVSENDIIEKVDPTKLKYNISVTVKWLIRQIE